MFTLRFDMRAPTTGAPATELYAAAIDMCEWSETRGAAIAVLSEHHGTDDGHLPTPLVMATAIAARTRTLAILLAAVPIPLWDPVRLAEEICVLDLISRGRVAYAFGIGHRSQEYDLFGVDFSGRGRLADEMISVVTRLVRGEAVDYRGRRVVVTPACTSPRGPQMLVAGGSRAAARRAAKFGLGFISQTDEPGLEEFYESQCRANGHEPGPVQLPVRGTPTAAFVADDVEAAWLELGPFLLHDAVTAASYRAGDDSVASITRAESIAALRTSGSPYRIFSSDEAVDHLRAGRLLPLHPLCGGVPPEVAWPYLHRAAAVVQRCRTK